MRFHLIFNVAHGQSNGFLYFPKDFENRGLEMGGCGSGRHHGARKRRVESCLSVDVRQLARAGALAPDATGTLTWERNRGAHFRGNLWDVQRCAHCAASGRTGQ